MSPAISVIVPATNQPPTLQRCVASIEPELGKGDELIAVTEAEGAGPAAARNEGAARASAPILLFVDADVVLAAGAIARVRSAFDGSPELVALFGSYDDRPEAPGVPSRFRNLLHHYTHQQAAGPINSFWAGIGAVRADAFVGVGGFDPDLYERPSIEDIELGLRLADAGGRIDLDPGLQGTHLKSWSVGSMLRTDLLDRGMPWVELLRDRREVPAQLNLGWGQRVAALAAVGLVLSVLLRSLRLSVISLVALIASNLGLYRLLVSRLGPGGAAAALPLHVAHLLVAAASVPLGLARGALRGARR